MHNTCFQYSLWNDYNYNFIYIIGIYIMFILTNMNIGIVLCILNLIKNLLINYFQEYLINNAFFQN